MVAAAKTRQTSALRGTADSLLDSASYGARWVLLSPAPAAGVVSGSPTPTLTFSLVGGSSQFGPARCARRLRSRDRNQKLRQQRDSFHVRTNVRTSSPYHGRSGWTARRLGINNFCAHRPGLGHARDGSHLAWTAYAGPSRWPVVRARRRPAPACAAARSRRPGVSQAEPGPGPWPRHSLRLPNNTSSICQIYFVYSGAWQSVFVAQPRALMTRDEDCQDSEPG
jgi:hypothetical protein